MVRIYILLFASIGLISQVKAQNLLPDGGFELLDSCPWTYAINDNQFWTNCTWGTPDQFDTCNGVPQNNVGWQKPHGGHGYAGLVTYGRNGYREYMRSALTAPMQDAKTYCIEFWISLADYSLRKSWAPQLYFSAAPVSANMDTNLLLIPQWQDTSFLCNDTANWFKVSGVFNCFGNYNYVTIGNFYNNANTNSPPFPSALNNAYYYIDDMSITECNPANTGIPDKSVAPILIQNPVENIITFEFKSSNSKAEIIIFNMNGTKIYSCNINGNKTIEIPISNWAAGNYFYRIQQDNSNFSGKLIVR